MAMKNMVLVDPETGENIGTQLLAQLRQLFYKIPKLTSNANDVLRVTVESGSIGSAYNYPRFTMEGSNEIVAVKGQQYSNMRWQQQRNLLVD